MILVNERSEELRVRVLELVVPFLLLGTLSVIPGTIAAQRIPKTHILTLLNNRSDARGHR